MSAYAAQLPPVVPLRIRPSDEARLIDVIARTKAVGQHLVTNGTDVYFTPMVMPGEFRVGIHMREAA
jgi:hypothetical protein